MPSPTILGFVAIIISSYAPCFDTFDEFVDCEVSRLDAIEGGDVAAEDVINPFALACFFEDDHVLGLFDDADSAFIAAWFGANRASIGFGEVVADFALFDFGFDVADGLGEGQCLGGFGLEDMKGQPFGGLGANARKASQLLNQFIYCFSIAGRHKILTISSNIAESQNLHQDESATSFMIVSKQRLAKLTTFNKIPDTMKKLLVLTTVLLLIGAAGCKESVDPNEPVGFIQVKGSDTIVNAAQEVSEEFMKDYPHVFVAVTGGGSGVGIASLINKTCDVATASREMKPKEIEVALKHGVTPKEFTVAYDGVAVIVNKDNPVDKLTIEDLHKIFTGKAKNWKEFGGKDLGIVTISREVSSGTHIYFKEQVVQLGKKENTEEFSNETLLLSSSQAIVEEVAANEAAIGYLGMGYTSERTKSLADKQREGLSISPDVNNVMKKKYPLSRGLYFYTDGEPNGIKKLFIDFALGPKGQERFRNDAGLCPWEIAIVEKN